MQHKFETVRTKFITKNSNKAIRNLKFIRDFLEKSCKTDLMILCNNSLQ